MTGEQTEKTDKFNDDPPRRSPWERRHPAGSPHTPHGENRRQDAGAPGINRRTAFSFVPGLPIRANRAPPSASSRAAQIRNTHRNCRRPFPRPVRRGARGIGAPRAGRNAHNSNRRANPRGISCRSRRDPAGRSTSTARRNDGNDASLHLRFWIFDLRYQRRERLTSQTANRKS